MIYDRLGMEIIKGCIVISVHHPYLFIVSDFRHFSATHIEITLRCYEPPSYGSVPYDIKYKTPNPHIEVLYVP